MSILTSLQVGMFLKDFEKNATVEIIEGSKQTSEIVKIAKAKDIDLKNNRDLAGFKAIYGWADRPNYNKDMVNETELLKSLPSIISKPVNIGHLRRYCVGHIIDYRYQKKDKKIIVFGVFYKSNFGTEWKRAKREFDNGDLSASWEIHSPDDQRRRLPNGVYELNGIEHAGMAILFKDDEDPAAAGAKVLSMAKKQMDDSNNLDLIYAKKYKDADIITAGDIYKEEVEKNLKELKEKELADKEIVEPKVEKSEVVEPKEVIEPKKEEITVKEPESFVNPKITCSSCSEEFEILPGQLTYKCPKCFSILDSVGTQKYPPQLKDFRLACPNCSSNNWLILKNEENKTILKCQSEICNKTFEIEFAQEKKNELLDKTAFLYTNTVSCIQCGTMINIAGSSQIKAYEVSCPKCKLTFNYNKTKAIKDRQIIKITEIEEPKIEEEKSSKKGGEEDVKIPKEIVEKVKEEEKAPKVEAPKEEVKKEEVPKVEEKVVVEEVKVEAPKVEAPIEKVELAPEAPKKASIARRAVKKIMALKKDLRTAKTIQERKEITLKTAIKKVASQLILARAEVKKIKKEADEKIELYKEEAKTILKRRDELGEKYVGDLSDKDILNDDKFKTASLQKEVTLLKASKEKTDEIVGDKSDEDINSEDEKLSREIDAKAFTK